MDYLSVEHVRIWSFLACLDSIIFTLTAVLVSWMIVWKVLGIRILPVVHGQLTARGIATSVLAVSRVMDLEVWVAQCVDILRGTKSFIQSLTVNVYVFAPASELHVVRKRPTINRTCVVPVVPGDIIERNLKLWVDRWWTSPRRAWEIWTTAFTELAVLITVRTIVFGPESDCRDIALWNSVIDRFASLDPDSVRPVLMLCNVVDEYRLSATIDESQFVRLCVCWFGERDTVDLLLSWISVPLIMCSYTSVYHGFT